MRSRFEIDRWKPLLIVLVFFVSCLAMFSLGCGSKRGGGGGGGHAGGPVNAAFMHASAQYGVPVQLL